MTRIERSFYDLTMVEQEAVLCNMVCRGCGKSSLAYPDIRIYEEDGVEMIEASCSRCGSRIADELEALFI